MYIEQTSGYWGDVTSSVDWCEYNYEHSYYVAEWFNTISSLALVLFGEFGAYYNYSTSWKQRYSFHMLSIVGLGSILFHMMLKYESQMLDEVPMVWTTALTLIVGLESRYGKLPSWVFCLVTFATATGSLLIAFSSGPLQVTLFRITFAIIEVSSILLGIVNSFSIPSKSPFHKMSYIALGIMLIAIIIWVSENNFCSTLRDSGFNPQLHSIWHMLMAYGCYQAILFNNVVHQVNMGYGAPKLNYIRHWLPYISQPTSKGY